jgi:5-methylcytosine-specific restriction endonuclease McrA
MPKGFYQHKKWSKESKDKLKGRDPWNKGTKGLYSKEYIEKLSKAKIGRKIPDITKEKMSKSQKVAYLEGRRVATCKGKSGEGTSNWQGGITPLNYKIRNSIEFRLWRESVFARDNWICQKCNDRGSKIQAHHIQNFAQYSELRFAIDNGITLCRECHILFHKKYSKKNNNIIQIKEFIYG